MALSNIPTDVQNTSCNLIVDAIDVGSAVDALLVILTIGDLPLVSLILSNPAYGDSVGGVAPSNAITTTVVANTGTAFKVQIYSRDAILLFRATLGTGSGELNFDDLSFVADDVVSISSFTMKGLT